MTEEVNSTQEAAVPTLLAALLCGPIEGGDDGLNIAAVHDLWTVDVPPDAVLGTGRPTFTCSGNLYLRFSSVGCAGIHTIRVIPPVGPGNNPYCVKLPFDPHSPTVDYAFGFTIKIEGAGIHFFEVKVGAATLAFVPVQVATRISGTDSILPGPMPVNGAGDPGENQIEFESSSFRDPTATDACRGRITARECYYSEPQEGPELGRVRLPIESQSVALKSALLCLQDLTWQLRAGRRHLLGHLASELKALIYWHDNPSRRGRPHSALLLRLAARTDSALPIYVTPSMFDDPDAPDVIRKTMIGFEPGFAGIYRESPRQEIVDLQDWLSRTAFVERASSGGLVGDEARRRSLKDLIAAIANSLGSGHYDEDVPAELFTLHQLDHAAPLLIKASDLTIQCGNHLLGILKARGLCN